MRKCFSFGLILLSLAVLVGCGDDSVEALHAQGKKAFDERKYDEAVTSYRTAINTETTDRDLLLDCARAYRRLARYDSALYFLKRADLMHPRDKEINEQVREVAISLGDWQNAIDAIETLASLSGSHDPYFEELADLWLRNGHEGRAFYWSRKALRKNPDLRSFYVQTAKWAARYDSVNVAVELMDTAIAHFGPESEFLYNKAVFLASRGDLFEAEQILRPMAQSGSAPILRLTLAGVLESYPERAKKAEALEIYRELRAEMPVNSPIDSLIGHLEKLLE